jgi:predicted DNA-binding protein
LSVFPAAARLEVKRQKIRHQLFLTQELSARLERIATGTGRARSELLVEALEAWLNRRNPAAAEEALGARLTRFERHVEAVRRQQGLQWEVLARMLRHQLLTAAALPPADAAAQASALRAFEAAIDEMADRLAGREPALNADPGIAKIRRFH